MSITDQKLVSRFLETGNEQTFREIYQRHTPALYMLALRLNGGKEDDAQDALQEVWIRACRKLGDFNWNSKLRTWLSGILINCVREIQKKKQRRNEEELNEENFSINCKLKKVNIDLEKIIRNLPKGYRYVLVLHDIEGYTHKEISQLLNINIGTSKSQLFQARKLMRSILQGRAERQ